MNKTHKKALRLVDQNNNVNLPLKELLEIDNNNTGPE